MILFNFGFANSKYFRNINKDTNNKIMLYWESFYREDNKF